MDMKRRILSCFLAFCMIFALLPAPAQAVENAENAAPTVKATVQHAETGQITAQIEAYMTDPANKTRTVKPCDIIFLIEQSKFMNTQNGSANSGDERAEILSAIDRLLDGMPQPTTGGKHRIAIAGYGRINNPGIGDSYDAALYPGTLSSSNASLNTGYYTKDDTKGVFHSQSGWTECDFQDDASLPQLPSNYLTDDYEDVFLSVSDAKQVIDANTMVPWYAGAARMDAGLTITERLASIAKAHKSTGEDRNLIVCIAASSLPYQNSGTYQQLRPNAAIEAANMLKETYDATIFGLGDFHQLNLESSNPLHDVDKQRLIRCTGIGLRKQLPRLRAPEQRDRSLQVRVLDQNAPGEHQSHISRGLPRPQDAFPACKAPGRRTEAGQHGRDLLRCSPAKQRRGQQSRIVHSFFLRWYPNILSL